MVNSYNYNYLHTDIFLMFEFDTHSSPWKRTWNLFDSETEILRDEDSRMHNLRV